MTFSTRAPWIPLEDLVSLPRGLRIKYVRTNLASPRPGSEFLSHDDFATAVGAKGRSGPIRWEKGKTPRAYADAIAALTPYPAAAFGADGEAELVVETLGGRLRALAGETAWLRDQVLRIADVLALELDPPGEQSPPQSAGARQ